MDKFKPHPPYHARVILDVTSDDPIHADFADLVKAVLESHLTSELEYDARLVPTDELDFIADLIENEKYDQATDQIERLERRLGGSTPETTTLSTRIARIQILGV